ncbi:MAG TPA: LamB/YcsF family protein, partial [Afipia sp.]
SKPGAVLHDGPQIAQRVVRMVQDGAIIAASGKIIKVKIDTVCIHGDTPGAVEIARHVRAELQRSGVAIKPFDRR